MSTWGEGLQRTRLRAPSGDGKVLAVPSLAEAVALVHANRALLAEGHILGRPLAELRTEVRRALDLDPHRPLIVTGHQPELFHPGVWAKNFAASHLAAATSGQALNLVIDSDTIKTTALRVPHADSSVRPIPFDRWTGETPWEGRTVLDRDAFANFGPAVLSALAPFGYRPILADVWGELRELVLGENRPLGEAFSAARRSVERSFGVDNREVALSRLWSLPPFAHLARAISSDLPRFHAVYNGAVRAYRQAHGIKSRSHPVPDLEVRDGRYEAPFWLLRPGGRRERLFWGDPNAHGERLRSRALTTTLAARLLLADLFIHGLGGGLYDALTDVILRDFFGLTPPPFAVVTATLRLPIPRPEKSASEERRLSSLLRELRYNPQRHRDDPAVAERESLVRWRPTTPAERRERFLALRRLNAEIAAPLAGRVARAEADLVTARRQRAIAEGLGRRDFGFVLFPRTSFERWAVSLQ